MGKRVQSTDAETEHPPSSRLNASAILSEDPKTSEFAFFRKLKKDAGQTFHSSPLDRKQDQLENFAPSDCTSDMTNMVRHSFKNLKSSLLIQNVSTENLDLFPSPPAGPLKNSEMTKTVDHNLKILKSSLLNEKVAPINLDSFPSALGGAGKNSGTKHGHEGVFCIKRRRLHQWVVDTSPGIDDLCSKGYDLVSVLLGRLLPESNKNSCYKDPRPGQARIDTKSELLDLPESDACLKKLQWTTTSDFMGHEYVPYMNEDSSALWSNNSRNVIHWNWHSLGCDSPIINANETHLQYKIREPDCNLDGGQTASLPSDAAVGLSFGKYLSLASNHLKEQDEFYDSNECALGRKPQTLLLGWNFDNMEEDQGLFSPTDHNELSLYATMPTLWCDSDQQSWDDRLDASGSCLSSFFSDCPSNFTSSPHFDSVNYCNLDSGIHVLLEDKRDEDAALEHLPLALSCNPNNHNMAEDCNYETAGRSSSFFISPQNHSLFINKFLSDKHLPSLDTVFVSSGLNYDLGQNSLAITEFAREYQLSTYHAHQFPQKEGTSLYFLAEDKYKNFQDVSGHGEMLENFTRDILNIHDWSSFSFQISLDKEKVFPLLLDESSCDRSERETYCDDSDFKCI